MASGVAAGVCGGLTGSALMEVEHSSSKDVSSELQLMGEAAVAVGVLDACMAGCLGNPLYSAFRKAEYRHAY